MNAERLGVQVVPALPNSLESMTLVVGSIPTPIYLRTGFLSVSEGGSPNICL
jgi:hypothetical protein